MDRDQTQGTPAGIPTRPPRGTRPSEPVRRLVPAGNVLVVMVVCLLLWSFLSARTLERSSDA